MRIGLVTCRELPEPDPDEGPLMHALAMAGVQPQLVAWDDPEASPSAYDLCVLRSAWNYYHAPADFLGWIEAAARVTRLVNPPPVVRWNIHKRYLQELRDAGLPVVPTVWIPRGSAANLSQLISDQGWSRWVIKPAISAASFQTRCFGGEDGAEGQSFLDDQLAVRDMMVQKYMDGVDRCGERSLVWIDGQLTHAVRKQPRFAGGREQVLTDASPSEVEHYLVERAMERWAPHVRYARLDVMPDDMGRPMISELELIEPSLFFPQSPVALERFVRAVLRDASA